MNFISRDTDYAMRALIYMGRFPERKIFTVEEILKKTSLPERFLRRILQRLAKKGIIISYKGKNGGFSLCKKPGQISFIDVIEALQGKIDLTNCFLKKRLCPDVKKCALRKRLRRIGVIVNRELKNITIGVLLNEKMNSNAPAVDKGDIK